MKRPPGMESSSGGTVKILSVSPSDGDYAALCDILQNATPDLDANCRWTVQPARSIASAAEVLARQEIPILISDDRLFPGNWQTLLQYISRLPDPPLLIVVSRTADERLWAEALNLGAWDVLAKPLDAQEVIHVVTSAWRHWQDRRTIGTRHEFAAAAVA